MEAVQRCIAHYLAKEGLGEIEKIGTLAMLWLSAALGVR